MVESSKGSAPRRHRVMNLPAADVLTVSPEGTITFPVAGPVAE
jgi:hypothetical protein